METGIKVTDNAAKRIAFILSKDSKDSKFRISVDSGGCSGFKYKFGTDITINSDDLVIEKNGATILIDSTAQEFMRGCVIDFIETLGNAEFEVRNPNATAKCGCGNSFSI